MRIAGKAHNEDDRCCGQDGSSLVHSDIPPPGMNRVRRWIFLIAWFSRVAWSTLVSSELSAQPIDQDESFRFRLLVQVLEFRLGSV